MIHQARAALDLNIIRAHSSTAPSLYPDYSYKKFLMWNLKSMEQANTQISSYSYSAGTSIIPNPDKLFLQEGYVYSLDNWTAKAVASKRKVKDSSNTDLLTAFVYIYCVKTIDIMILLWKAYYLKTLSSLLHIIWNSVVLSYTDKGNRISIKKNKVAHLYVFLMFINGNGVLNAWFIFHIYIYFKKRIKVLKKHWEKQNSKSNVRNFKCMQG